MVRDTRYQLAGKKGLAPFSAFGGTTGGAVLGHLITAQQGWKPGLRLGHRGLGGGAAGLPWIVWLEESGYCGQFSALLCCPFSPLWLERAGSCWGFYACSYWHV